MIKDIWHIIKELLFLIASILFFLPMALVGFVYTFIKHLFKWDYSLEKQLSPIIRGITLAVDGFGNSASGELLNDLTSPIVKYGKWYQTVSAVSGINQYKDHDTRLRAFTDVALGHGHCKDAVQDNDKCLYKINKT